MSIFDIFKNLKKSNVSKINKKTNISTFFPQIPNNIRSMLWFVDGKEKNIDKSFEEPSAISIHLSLSKENPEELGYWPRYENMSPEQRYGYLMWLTDIDQKSDIGYVFTFFYGLERWIQTDRHEEAIKLIIRLKKHYDEISNSFNGYSNNALIYYAMLYKNPYYLQFINPNGSATYLMITKGVLNHKLTAEEIMDSSKSFGWTNQRYIKSYPDIFKKHLESLILEKFHEEDYPIPDNIGDIPNMELILSNVSLNARTNVMRYEDIDIEVTQSVSNPLIISIPDFSQSATITKDTLNLLKAAHERTKTTLKNLRKNGINNSPSTNIKKTIPKKINKKTGYPMSTDKAIKNAKEMYEMEKDLVSQKMDMVGLNSDMVEFYKERSIRQKYSTIHSLGNLYYKQGEWDLAEQQWLSLIRIMPERSATSLAIMFHKEKRYKDEVSIIEDGIKFGVNNTLYPEVDNLKHRLTKSRNFFDRHLKSDQSKGYNLTSND